MSLPVPQSLLGGHSPAQFMREHWQHKPLLVRGAFDLPSPPLDKHELAGLACEEAVNSRIVQEHHPDGPWKLDYGPFDAAFFADLPETHWTLLVSDVEKHMPELQALVEPFRFIADWRIDDLMISYAADQGSVGPHTDDYDVFLIQLEGRREWRISEQVDHDAIIDDIDLRILEHFEAEHSWILEPGDMLYLPPRIAHYGIAQGECMTASVGFRAPSHRDILQGYFDEIILRIPEDLRYGDAGTPPATHPGSISPESMARFRQIVEHHLHLDDAGFEQWLGRFLTEPKTEMDLPVDAEGFTAEAFEARLAAGHLLSRNPHSRFAWTKSDHGLTLFVDQQSWTLPTAQKADLLRLTEQRQWRGDEFSPSFHQILHQLYRMEAVLFDDDE